MRKWINRQIGAFALATASVEQNALGQEGFTMDMGEREEQSHKKGTLEYALVKGEMTQEVVDLRWRMYKMLDASDKIIVTSLGVDEDGYHTLDIEEPNEKGLNMLLRKVKLDEFDDYPLEMVVKNEPITMGVSAAFNENVSVYTETQIDETLVHDIRGNVIGATIGEIDNDAYQSFINPGLPVEVIREFMPKFEIEKYTKRVNIRNISSTEKLIEFYVSKYPDEFDRKTRLFLSELKRGIENPRTCDMLEIKNVSFTTYRTVGVKDFRRYVYDVQSFDKIIEFDGNYVIKFKCVVTTDGEYLLEKFREEELDLKYKNKESKE